MRVCRKCKKQWPDTMTACPEDGWSLTMEVDATYHPPVSPSGGAQPTGGLGRGPSAAVAAQAAPVEEHPPTTDLVPGFVVGEYRIEKKIGEGGMGAVYSATHP